MGSRLADRSALITGSTSGIGEAIALAMAAAGAHVIVTGRDLERGTKVADAITAAGGRATFVAADLSGGGQAARALAESAVDAAGGRLDILVNNAAFLIGGRATVDTDEALIDQALSVSVKAPFLLTAAIVPAMIERGDGAIVNIGSINGIVGMAGSALYGATKAALHSLTKSWAAEFGPYGVRVNTVAPGPTLTAHNESIREHLDNMLSTVPSRRMSTLAEVAAAAVFLASSEASNIHGATLSVDGGFTSR
jgi:NAD(P)-dependent dehydrogenase (short-subunit alcohol dehydrogenase family)